MNQIKQRFFSLDDAEDFLLKAKKAGLEPVLAHIYASRGVTDYDDLRLNLKWLHHYEHFKGIDQAVDRLILAVTEQQRILIIGDFDADGATSTAVAVRGLQALGATHVDYLVPNRFEFGYGLSVEIVEAGLLQFKPQCIITVDNGIADVDGVNRAQQAGVDVIITDHHLPAHTLPNACAIVNPNQNDCEFPSKNLAGVGVIFYTLLALRAALKRRLWFENRSEPNFSTLLDLVALGTVADVVPLDRNNRILVAEGLKRIQNGRACEGIKALIAVAKREAPTLNAQDFGFALGPRLNAAGRLDDMTIGIQCLLTDDPAKAMSLALELDQLNKARKEIEAGMKTEAETLLEQAYEQFSGSPHEQGLVLYDAHWHPGVVGILAARIKEQTNCPVICFTEHSETQMKGSARSIPGIHIRDVLDSIAKQNPDLIISFGGHAMAAGLTVVKAGLDTFRQAFSEVTQSVADESIWQKQRVTDGVLDKTHLSLEFADLLQQHGPWGQRFPEPCFHGEGEVLQARWVGERHWKMKLRMAKPAYRDVEGIFFNPPRGLELPSVGQLLVLIYRLGINRFRGEVNVQLMLEEVDPVVAEEERNPMTV